MSRIGILYYYFIPVLLFYGINNGFAQIQVTKGSTHHYTVSPVPASENYYYHWSISPGGTSSNISASDTTIEVLWDGAIGSYTMAIYPVKPVSLCTGGNQTLFITVVDMDIKWSSNSSTQCPKTDNQSGDFQIAANYLGVSGAWSFKYSIDGTVEQTVNIASGNNATINIDGFFNPSTTIPAIHTIRILSVTAPDKHTVNFTGTEFNSATRLYTVTIDPTPGTSGIIQL